MLTLLLALGCRDAGLVDSGEPLPLCSSSADGLVFEDLAPELGMEDAGHRNRGVAAADFDLDGDVDLFLANPGDPSRLWLNQGDNSFEASSQSPNTPWTVSASAVDFDDDGDPDLVLTCGGFSATCANGLFRNEGLVDGELRWTDLSESSGVGLGERMSFGAAWGDVDGDGDLDLYISNQDPEDFWADSEQGGPTPEGGDMPEGWPGPPDLSASSSDELWINEGGGRFTAMTWSWGLGESSGNSHQAAFADLDSDGDMDLVVPVFLGPNQLYWNEGGHFVLDETGDFEAPWAAFGVLVRDLDQDGVQDLLFAANHDGHMGEAEPHALWLFEQGGARVEVASELDLMEAFGQRYGVMGLQAADLDLDGFPELFFGNGNPMPDGAQTNVLLSAGLSGGAPVLRDVSATLDLPVQGSPFRSHGTGVADFDGDGLLDLFLGNGGIYADQAEPNRLFMNRSSCRNPALWVRLEGPPGNSAGLGTRLRVEGSEGGVVYAWVRGSSGFMSSLPAETPVGLGALQEPLSLSLSWPDGSHTELEGIQADERLLIAW